MKYKETDWKLHMKQHRNKIGICPQYNIIFPNLTTHEHLYLFSIFKGINQSEFNKYYDEVNSELRLNTFIDKQVYCLSGGQKRRLSISIAMLGESDLVVLDEPTAGLDPTSRRELWDLLKKTK